MYPVEFDTFFASLAGNKTLVQEITPVIADTGTSIEDQLALGIT